jgi:hypothetical protein
VKLKLTPDANEWVDSIFGHYITGMISDGDEARAKRELLDVMRAEVKIQLAEREALLLQRAQEIAELEAAISQVVTTFERDEAQGYHSRDRQFAIETLKRHR